MIVKSLKRFFENFENKLGNFGNKWENLSLKGYPSRKIGDTITRNIYFGKTVI